MKPGTNAPLGFVADGYRRYTRSDEFRAREREVRRAVFTEFAPKLEQAQGWRERLRLRWQRHRALREELCKLYPPPGSCFFRAEGRDGLD